jgi:hypothetical protein
MKATCLNCKKTFVIKEGGRGRPRKYCSLTCTIISNNNRARAARAYGRELCPACGNLLPMKKVN